MIVNKKIALAMFFIFAVGLCSGAFFEIYMKGEGKTQLMDMLSGLVSGSTGQSFISTFWNSFRTWIAMLLITFYRAFPAAACHTVSFFPNIKRIDPGVFCDDVDRNLRRQRHLVHNFNHTSAKSHSNPHPLRAHRALHERRQ